MSDSSLQPQPPSGLPQRTLGQYDRDQEHLKMLSICYYVAAGLTALGALFTSIYVIMGGVMMSGVMPSASGSPQDEKALQFMGGTFFVIGILGTLFMITIAVLQFMVARRIVLRQSRVFCLVIAGLTCLNAPLGTALGVFTFIVMSRAQVASSFDQQQSD